MRVRSDAYLIVMPFSPEVPGEPPGDAVPEGLPVVPTGWSAVWEDAGWATVRGNGRVYATLLVRKVDASTAVYLWYQRSPGGRGGLDEVSALPGSVYAVPAVDAWREAGNEDPAAQLYLRHLPDYLCSGEDYAENFDANNGPLGVFTWTPFSSERRRVSHDVIAPALWPSADTLPLAVDRAGNVVSKSDPSAVLYLTDVAAPDLTQTIAGYDDGGGEFDRAIWTSSLGPYSDTYGDDYHHA